MLRKEFPGEILLQGAPVPMQVSVGLELMEGEVRGANEAYFDMCLNLPDESILHFHGSFSRRILTKTAGILESVANGKSDADWVIDNFHSFILKFHPIPGDDMQVAVDGESEATCDDTNIGPQWQGIITEHGTGDLVEASFHGLLLARCDVVEMAAQIREFLGIAGDALIEPSIYDD